MKINIYDTKNEWVLNTSNYLTNKIIAIINEKGHAHISLCGGSTPFPIYNKLKDNLLEFKDKITLWLGDERAVPMNSSDRNETNISNVFNTSNTTWKIESWGDLTNNSIETMAIEYENRIKSNIPNYSYDLILLGIGTDGHTASLFPNTDILKNLNNYTGVAVSPDATKRLTITFKTIELAKEIIFIAGLKNKEQFIDGLAKLEGNFPALNAARINSNYSVFTHN